MDISNDYIKGFNSGYIIRKNHPLLMKNLIKGAKGNSELLEGLKAGSIQYEKEMGVKVKDFKAQKDTPKIKPDRGMEY